jgi:hypothetical protein
MLLATGIAAMVWALCSLASHLPTMFYSTAQGKVISATIEHVVVGRISLHSPRIRYEYSVNGSEYVNDRYGPSAIDNEGTDEWAHGVAQSFSGGGPCTVYYNSSEPAESVLRRAPTAQSVWLAIGMGLLGTLAALGAIVQTWASYRGRTN